MYWSFDGFGVGLLVEFWCGGILWYFGVFGFLFSGYLGWWFGLFSFVWLFVIFGLGVCWVLICLCWDGVVLLRNVSGGVGFGCACCGFWDFLDLLVWFLIVCLICWAV